MFLPYATDGHPLLVGVSESHTRPLLSMPTFSNVRNLPLMLMSGEPTPYHVGAELVRLYYPKSNP